MIFIVEVEALARAMVALPVANQYQFTRILVNVTVGDNRIVWVSSIHRLILLRTYLVVFTEARLDIVSGIAVAKS